MEVLGVGWCCHTATECRGHFQGNTTEKTVGTRPEVYKTVCGWGHPEGFVLTRVVPCGVAVGPQQPPCWIAKDGPIPLDCLHSLWHAGCWTQAAQWWPRSEGQAFLPFLFGGRRTRQSHDYIHHACTQMKIPTALAKVTDTYSNMAFGIDIGIIAELISIFSGT